MVGDPPATSARAGSGRIAKVPVAAGQHQRQGAQRPFTAVAGHLCLEVGVFEKSAGYKCIEAGQHEREKSAEEQGRPKRRVEKS